MRNSSNKVQAVPFEDVSFFPRTHIRTFKEQYQVTIIPGHREADTGQYRGLQASERLYFQKDDQTKMR